MSIAEAVLKKVADNLPAIAGGAALAAAGAGAGYAAKAVIDDHKFQKRAGEIYELGVKKGAKLGGVEARKVFVDPLLARIAVSRYIALADGKISRAEQKLLDAIISGVNANPNFPNAAIKEIEKITSAETLPFESVVKYLERLNISTLEKLAVDIGEIAGATKGISYKERAAIDEFERYLFDRLSVSNKSRSAPKGTEVLPVGISAEEDTLDDYFDNLFQNQQ